MNHTWIKESIEWKVFKNITFFGEIPNNWSNDLFGTNVFGLFDRIDNHYWQYYNELILLQCFLNEECFNHFYCYLSFFWYFQVISSSLRISKFKIIPCLNLECYSIFYFVYIYSYWSVVSFFSVFFKTYWK